MASSDSDSDADLDPKIKAAALKRAKDLLAAAPKAVFSLDQLLQTSKKRQANIAKSEAASAELKAREERLASEQAELATAALAAAAAQPASGPAEDAPPGDVDVCEAAGLRAACLFTHTVRLLPLRAFKLLEAGGDPLLTQLNGRVSSDPQVVRMLNDWMQSYALAAVSRQRPEGGKLPDAPASLLAWLFHVACTEANADVSASAARALATVIRGGPDPSGGDPTTADGAGALPPAVASAAAWVPPPAAFAAAFVLYGADVETLVGAGDAVARVTQASTEYLGGDGADAGGAAVSPDFRRNIPILLELVPACAPHWRATLGGAELTGCVRWLWRLLIEPHAAPALFHIQVRSHHARTLGLTLTP